MKKVIFMMIVLFIQPISYAQNVGIGTITPDNSAILDITSNNKGLLVPRLADTTVISEPKEGLVIFNQTMKSLNFHDGIQWRNLTNITSAASRDSITISLNGGIETPIRTYEQELTRTLAANGQPNSSIKGGTFFFTKKYDANSDILKEHCFDPFSTFTTVIFKFYNMNTGISYYQVKFERAYIYGCKDSTDLTNGFVESYSITANKITIGVNSYDNGWPL